MKGYTKTTTLGDEDCIILEPRETYTRRTSLPVDWATCRIGFFFSVVGTVDGNAAPVTEHVVNASVLDILQIGLCNGDASLQSPGNKFAGCVFSSSTGIDIAYAAPVCQAFNVTWMYACTSNAGSQTYQDSAIAYLSGNHHEPTQTSSFAQFIGVEFVRDATTLAVRLIGESDHTDVSALATRTRLMSGTYVTVGTVTSTTDDTWDLTTLLIRSPLIANYLRLHAIEVMQLA